MQPRRCWGGLHDRRHPRRLRLRPGVDCLKALGQLAEAVCEAHVLHVELRAGLANDLLETRNGLCGLELALLPHRPRLCAEVGDDGEQRLLRLVEGRSDANLGGAQVGLEVE